MLIKISKHVYKRKIQAQNKHSSFSEKILFIQWMSRNLKNKKKKLI